jgi:hypothetical protein
MSVLVITVILKKKIKKLFFLVPVPLLIGQIAPSLQGHLAPNKEVYKNHEISVLYINIIILKNNG